MSNVAGSSDASDGAPVAQHGAGQRRPRTLRTEGPLCVCVCVCILVASAAGRWVGLRSGGGSESSAPPADVVVGIALVVSWVLSRQAEGRDSCEGRRLMRAEALRNARGARACYGFVESPVVEVAKLQRPQLRAGRSPGDLFKSLGDQSVRLAKAGAAMADAPMPFSQALAQWRATCRSLHVVALELCPAVAENIVNGLWSVANVVAITQRVNRQLLLNPKWPSADRLRAFSQATAGESSQAAAPSASVPLYARYMHDPHLVIDWLSASLYIKDQKETAEAGASFCRILSRSTGIDEATLVQEMPVVNMETLRLSRVRADVVTMMLWRRVFAQTLAPSDVGNVNVFLFADASPQWRGVETFCASFDLVVSDIAHRRLMPLITLSRDMLDTTGKLLGLLWQLWLCAGPLYKVFRALCRRVRTITSDLGVERKLVDSINVTREFFTFVGHRSKWRASDLDDGVGGEDYYMFPRAVCIAGWRHMMDGLVKTGLTSLSWFPHWLDLCKGLVRFLRARANIDLIIRDFKKRKLHGMAELLARMSLVNFAAWRWNTLCDVCRALQPITRR